MILNKVESNFFKAPKYPNEEKKKKKQTIIKTPIERGRGRGRSRERVICIGSYMKRDQKKRKHF